MIVVSYLSDVLACRVTLFLEVFKLPVTVHLQKKNNLQICNISLMNFELVHRTYKGVFYFAVRSDHSPVNSFSIVLIIKFGRLMFPK